MLNISRNCVIVGRSKGSKGDLELEGMEEDGEEIGELSMWCDC